MSLSSTDYAAQYQLLLSLNPEQAVQGFKALLSSMRETTAQNSEQLRQLRQAYADLTAQGTTALKALDTQIKANATAQADSAKSTKDLYGQLKAATADYTQALRSVDVQLKANAAVQVESVRAQKDLYAQLKTATTDYAKTVETAASQQETSSKKTQDALDAEYNRWQKNARAITEDYNQALAHQKEAVDKAAIADQGLIAAEKKLGELQEAYRDELRERDVLEALVARGQVQHIQELQEKQRELNEVFATATKQELTAVKQKEDAVTALARAEQKRGEALAALAANETQHRNTEAKLTEALVVLEADLERKRQAAGDAFASQAARIDASLQTEVQHTTALQAAEQLLRDQRTAAAAVLNTEAQRVDAALKDEAQNTARLQAAEKDLREQRTVTAEQHENQLKQEQAGIRTLTAEQGALRVATVEYGNAAKDAAEKAKTAHDGFFAKLTEGKAHLSDLGKSFTSMFSSATTGFGTVGTVAAAGFGIIVSLGHMAAEAVTGVLNVAQSLVQTVQQGFQTFETWVRETGQVAQEMHTLQNVTGMTAEQAGTLFTVFQVGGGSVNQLHTALSKMQDQMVNNVQVFKNLNVATEDSTGKLRPAYDVLLDLADAWKGAGDKTAAYANLAQIFGDRFVTSVIQTLNLGSAGLRTLQDNLVKTGQVMSQEMEDKVLAANNTMRIFHNSLLMVEATVVSALQPAFQKLVAYLVQNLPKIEEMAARVALGIAAIVDGLLAGFGVKISPLVAQVIQQLGQLRTAGDEDVATTLSQKQAHADLTSAHHDEVAADDALRTSLEATRQGYRDQETVLRTTERAQQDLIRTTKEQFEPAIRAANSALHDARDALKDLQQAAKDSEAPLKAGIAGLREELKGLQQDAKDAEAPLKDGIAGLRDEVKGLQTDVKNLRAEEKAALVEPLADLRQLQAEFASLRDWIKTVKAEEQDLLAPLEASSARLELINARNRQDMEAATADLHKLIDGTQSWIDLLGQGLTTAVRGVDEDTRQWIEDLDKAKPALDGLEVTIDGITFKGDEVNQKFAEWAETLTTTSATIERIQQQMADLRDEESAIIDGLNEQLQAINDQIDALTESLHEDDANAPPTPAAPEQARVLPYPYITPQTVSTAPPPTNLDPGTVVPASPGGPAGPDQAAADAQAQAAKDALAAQQALTEALTTQAELEGKLVEDEQRRQELSGQLLTAQQNLERANQALARDFQEELNALQAMIAADQQALDLLDQQHQLALDAYKLKERELALADALGTSELARLQQQKDALQEVDQRHRQMNETRSAFRRRLAILDLTDAIKAEEDKRKAEKLTTDAKREAEEDLYQKQKREIQDRIATEKQGIADVKAQWTAARQAEAEAAREVKDLQGQITSLAKEQARDVKDLAAAQQKVAEAQDKITAGAKEHLAATKDLKSATEDVAKAQKESAAATKEAAAAAKEASKEAAQEAKSAREESKKATEEAKKSTEEAIRKLRTQAKLLQRQIAAVRKQYQTSLKQAENDLKNQQKVANNVKNAWAKAAKAAQLHENSLKNQVTFLEGPYKAAIAANTKLLDDQKQAIQDIKNLYEPILADLEKRASALSKDVDAQQAKIATIEADYNARITPLEDRVTSLQTQIDDKETELRTLEDHWTKLIESKQGEIDHKEAELRTLEEHWAKVIETKQGEINKLQDMVEKLQSEEQKAIEPLNQALQTTRDKMGGLQTDIAGVDSKLSELTGQARDLKDAYVGALDDIREQGLKPFTKDWDDSIKKIQDSLLGVDSGGPKEFGPDDSGQFITPDGQLPDSGPNANNRWFKIGKQIAEFLSGGWKSFDWEGLGEYIGEKLLIGIAKGTGKSLSAGNDKISQESLDALTDLEHKIHLPDSVIKWLNTKHSSFQEGDQPVSATPAAFTTDSADGGGGGISDAGTSLGMDLGLGLAKGLSDTLDIVYSPDNKDNLLTKWWDGVVKFLTEDAKLPTDKVKTHWQELSKAITGVLAEIFDPTGQPGQSTGNGPDANSTGPDGGAVAGGVARAGGAVTGAPAMAGQATSGKSVLETWWQGIKDFLTNEVQPWDKTGAKENWEKLITEILGPTDAGAGGGAAKGIFPRLAKGIKEWWGATGANGKGVASEIDSWHPWDIAHPHWQDLIDQLFGGDQAGGATGIFPTLAKDMKEWWGEVGTGGAGSVAAMIDSWHPWAIAKQYWAEGDESLFGGIKGVFDKLLDPAAGIPHWIDLIQTALKDGFGKTWGSMYPGMKEAYDNTKTTMENIGKVVNNLAKALLADTDPVTIADISAGIDGAPAPSGTPPTAEHQAAGGLVRQQPGGVYYRIAEGQAPEYVIPTDPQYRREGLGYLRRAATALGVGGDTNPNDPNNPTKPGNPDGDPNAPTLSEDELEALRRASASVDDGHGDTAGATFSGQPSSVGRVMNFTEAADQVLANYEAVANLVDPIRAHTTQIGMDATAKLYWDAAAAIFVGQGKNLAHSIGGGGALETIRTQASLINSIYAQRDVRTWMDAMQASTALLEGPFAGLPVEGVISQGFGPASGENGYGFHYGIDIAGPQGTPVHTPAAGKIVYDGDTGVDRGGPNGPPVGGLGHSMNIAHTPTLQTVYGHLMRGTSPPPGTLYAGQDFARRGNTGNSTGPHLHWEVHKDGVAVDPLQNVNLFETPFTPEMRALANSGSIADAVRAAIAFTHVPEDWFADLMTIAQHESSFNPNALNPSAVLLQNGTAEHASGAFQTLPSTFQTYAAPGHHSIFNPLDNAIAAINYIKARYGSAHNVPGVQAIKLGLPYQPYGDGGLAGVGGPEVTLLGDRGMPELVLDGATTQGLMRRGLVSSRRGPLAEIAPGLVQLAQTPPPAAAAALAGGGAASTHVTHVAQTFLPAQRTRQQELELIRQTVRDELRRAGHGG